MKTIIVATDFSAAAKNAAFYAADMAQAIQADLHLIHVYSLPVAYGEVTFAFDATQWQKDMEQGLEELKQQIQLVAHDCLSLSTEVRMGSFMPELQAVCQSLHPYAVVIGATGKTAAERMLLGSNAVYSMKHLAWPVIAVPETVRFTAIRKIGLACDLEDIGETVPFHEIGHWVNDFNAELHVLHTTPEHSYDADAVFASGTLGQLLSKYKPKFHFLSRSDADKGILDFAEKNQIDLLIVLPKRHGVIDSLLHRSHTKQFVLYSHVPVLSLHETTHTA